MNKDEKDGLRAGALHIILARNLYQLIKALK